MPPTYPRRPTCPERKRKQSHATIPNTCPHGSPPRSPALVTKIITHKQIPFPRGISPLRSDCRPRSGRNDIIKQADKKPSPLGALRGGVKHRKNSPQVTVFSQSGEVAMLRAGQAPATRQSPEREDGRIVHGRYTSSVGDFSTAFGLNPSLRSK